MSDLTELYREVILDHTKNPRNYGRLDGFDHTARGENPLCGDELTLYLVLDGDRVSDVRFEGQGCSISTSSASLMTQAVKGKSTAEVAELFEHFHSAITTPLGEDVDAGPLGKLAALTGVRQFPIRVKCASLAWHTLQAAIRGDAEPVSTE